MNPRLRRWEASEYLMRAHGVPVAASTLAKWVSVGGGPKFTKINRTPLYAPEDLDAWVSERLGVKCEPMAFENFSSPETDAEDPDIVDLLMLSVRSLHTLKALKVRTALDLASVTAEDLMGVRGCGRKTVAEVFAIRTQALSSAEWVGKLSPDLLYPLTIGTNG